MDNTFKNTSDFPDETFQYGGDRGWDDEDVDYGIAPYEVSCGRCGQPFRNHAYGKDQAQNYPCPVGAKTEPPKIKRGKKMNKKIRNVLIQWIKDGTKEYAKLNGYDKAEDNKDGKLDAQQKELVEALQGVEANLGVAYVQHFRRIAESLSGKIVPFTPKTGGKATNPVPGFFALVAIHGLKNGHNYPTGDPAIFHKNFLKGIRTKTLDEGNDMGRYYEQSRPATPAEIDKISDAHLEALIKLKNILVAA